MASNNVFSITLLSGIDGLDEQSKNVLGHRRLNAYEKMMNRARLNSEAIKFLPEVKSTDMYKLGKSSQRLYARIGYNIKKRKRISDELESEN